MDKGDGRQLEIVVLRAGMNERNRRQAGLFLTRGKYRLDLVLPPEGIEDPDDSYGWTAWTDLRYICEFYVYSPKFPSHPIMKDRRIFFPGGGRFPTKKEAAMSFMSLPEESRTITIDADSDKQGQPVFFFIDDSIDKDNRGGLTIRVVPIG